MPSCSWDSGLVHLSPQLTVLLQGSHFYGGYGGGALRNGWDGRWGEGEGRVNVLLYKRKLYFLGLTDNYQ